MSAKKVDSYIAKAQPFARPILSHMRALVGKAEPEAEEALRWGAPFFILEGRQLCGMASFKAHCTFMLEWEGSGAMGDLGRIASLDDLPSDKELVAAIRAKAKRIRSGEDAEARKKKNAPKKAKIPMPDDFASALTKQDGAESVWKAFTDAQRRGYLEWITSAKREATRQKRIATAVEWIGEGKKRNWKYQNC